MSAKPKIQYRCTECNFVSGKWSGYCLHCKAWETLVEETPAPKASSKPVTSSTRIETSLAQAVSMKQVADIAPSSRNTHRITSKSSEWDRVMGGGLIPGSFLVLTGDPGIGKSTLLLAIGDQIAQNQKRVFYFSSEESLIQITERAARLGLKKSPLYFSDSAELEEIIETAKQEKPDVLILDSIQNCTISQTQSLPGTIGQIRQAGFALMKLAKETGITVIVTGHITKDGTMAGPKVLEHMVDGVFYLQQEDRWGLRVLRSMKNRFGTTNELGFFQMEQTGMREIENINQYLLDEYAHLPGSTLTCSMEGSRPLLLELQALCVSTKFSMPQRVVTGLDPKRVLLIAAILEKYLHVKLSAFDIFFKVSGGCTLKESASDLSIALALLSSYFQKPLPEKTLPLGELNLTGQIRPVSHFELRVREAAKFGIQKIYTPQVPGFKTENSPTLVTLKNIYELLKFFPEDG